MYLMFALLVCLFSKETHFNRIKSVSTILKDKIEFFFAKSTKFSAVQMGHLHTCPLHLKLMPATSLSHILHNEEMRQYI